MTAPENVDLETGEVTEPEPDEDIPFEEPTPDEETDEEPQEATETEAVGFDRMSEGEQAKILDKLDREAERHTKRLQEIMLEDALMLLPCELCNPRHAGWVDLKSMSEEIRQRVRIMIGDREPVHREADRYAHRCESCDGEGEVETGSKVTGQGTLPCYECGGKGWVDPTGTRATGPKPVTVQPIATNGPAETGLTGPTAPPVDADVEEALALIRGRGYSAFATKLA